MRRRRTGRRSGLAWRQHKCGNGYTQTGGKHEVQKLQWGNKMPIIIQSHVQKRSIGANMDSFDNVYVLSLVIFK